MVSSHASVTIRGDGVAAWCSGFLLQKAGFQVHIQKTTRATVPAILLSNAALALLRDIFQQPEMFAGMAEIRKRVVAWGPSSHPVVLEHSGVVIPEQLLLDTIRSFVAVNETS